MNNALALMAIGALVVGCAAMAPTGPAALADLEPTTGNTAKGTVTFTQKGDKVVVVVKVSGLAPGQPRIPHPREGRLQLRRRDECRQDTSTRCGKPHAHPSTADRHAGDMPMLVADAAGNATLTVELDVITVGCGAGRRRRQGRDRPQGPGRLQDAANRQLRRARRLRRHPQLVTLPRAAVGPSRRAVAASKSR